RVARLARHVTPTTPRMLGRADEVDAALGGWSQLRVTSHPVGFTQRERGDAVPIHGSFLQISTMFGNEHATGQIVEPTTDQFLVGPLFGRVASSEKRENRQTGGPGSRGGRARIPT